MTQNENRPRVGGNYLSQQLQQALLQLLQVANRVQDGSDFEQGVKITGHAPYVGAGTRHGGECADIRGRQQIDGFGLAELHHLGDIFRVISDEENQFAAPDSNGVAVSQQFAANRYAIHECAVVTFEINELEGRVGFADGEVPPRNRAIAEAKMVG